MSTKKTHSIPKKMMEKYCNLSSVMSLSENKARGLINFQNKKYVVTGYSSMHGKGYLTCTAWEVIPFSLYKGKLPALSYHEKGLAVLEGKRSHGYPGQYFFYKKQKYVILDNEIEFQPTEEGTQITLF